MRTITTDKEFLHKPCDYVQGEAEALEVAESLFSAMRGEDIECDAQMAGLAANQLGINLRAFAMKLSTNELICFINPLLTYAKYSQVGPESCLSLPGQTIIVDRPKIIKIKGLNQYMKHVKRTLRGFEARIACHEIDHLCGELITDFKGGS